MLANPRPDAQGDLILCLRLPTHNKKGRAQNRGRYEPSPHLSIGILLLPAAAYEYTWDNKEESGWTSGMVSEGCQPENIRAELGFWMCRRGASPVTLCNKRSFYPQNKTLSMRRAAAPVINICVSRCLGVCHESLKVGPPILGVACPV